jgi:hypothetical protein
VRTIREGIQAGLEDLFSDPEVKDVVFGVACQPYNDESAGQGIYGPVVNFQPAYDDDFCNDDEYALFYDRPAASPKARVLGEVLRLADWKYAGEALGVNYYEDEGSGEDVAFVATRNNDGGYTLVEHRVGEY